MGRVGGFDPLLKEFTMNRRQLLKALPPAAATLASAPFAFAAAPRAGASAKPRIRSAICAYSYRDALGRKQMTYEDLVDIAVENDIDGLDLTVYWFPADHLNRFLASLRRKAYLAAVEIPSIAIRSNPCRPTAGEQQQEAAWLGHWVDVANQLGASHIRVFGGKVPEGADENDAAKWVTEILKRSADYARSKGVILGLENHGGITLHAKRIIEIVEAVDHPWVGINLDTGNFRSDPYAQMATCLPYAVNAQFKVTIHYEDGRREPCDWDRVMKMFAGAGYRGYVSLEYEAEEDPITAVPRHLGRLRDLARKYSA